MTNEKKTMTDRPKTAEDVPTVEVTKKYLNALRQAGIGRALRWRESDVAAMIAGLSAEAEKRTTGRS
jgi:hypothetical protein